MELLSIFDNMQYKGVLIKNAQYNVILSITINENYSRAYPSVCEDLACFYINKLVCEIGFWVVNNNNKQILIKIKKKDDIIIRGNVPANQSRQFTMFKDTLSKIQFNAPETDIMNNEDEKYNVEICYLLDIPKTASQFKKNISRESDYTSKICQKGYLQAGRAMKPYEKCYFLAPKDTNIDPVTLNLQLMYVTT